MVITGAFQNYEIKRNPLMSRLRIFNIPPPRKCQPKLSETGAREYDGARTRSRILADDDIEIMHPNIIKLQI